jgi:hypothetical protein
MELDKIGSYRDLRKIVDILSNQGFGYIDTYKLHQSKVDKLISSANKYGVKFDDNIKRKYQYDEKLTYDEIKNELDQYFSQFSPDTKIYELINKFYLVSDDSCMTPYGGSPSSTDIIKWHEFKTKFGLKDEFGYGNNVSVYNLDKNYIKVYFSEYSAYDFDTLYKLIFGEENIKIDGKKIGVWQDIGKIEIKLFQKGTAQIKGDLSKLKEYYFNSVNKPYRNIVIIYNKSKHILKSKNN